MRPTIILLARTWVILRSSIAHARTRALLFVVHFLKFTDSPDYVLVTRSPPRNWHCAYPQVGASSALAQFLRWLLQRLWTTPSTCAWQSSAIPMIAKNSRIRLTCECFARWILTPTS